MMKPRPDVSFSARHSAVPVDFKAWLDRLLAAGLKDIRSMALLLAIPLLCAITVRSLGLRLLSDVFDAVFLLSLAGYAAAAWRRRREAVRIRRSPPRRH